MNHCSHCGETVTRGIPPGDDRERFICPSCGAIHYQNPRMVVGCIPMWEDRLLLCRRAIEPRHGLWTLPAGFLEKGESVEEGARRELMEEALASALELRPYGLYNIRHVSQVYLMFITELASDEFGAGEETLEADLGRVYGLGDFELIDFTLEQEGENDVVVIRAQEKPWGPNYMHFGLFVASDFDTENSFSLLLNLTMTRLNKRGGEWRNDLQLGRDRLLLSELYQPLDFKGRWFVAPSLEFRREVNDFFAGGQAVAEFEVRRATGAVDLGYQLGRFGELRLGLEHGTATVDLLSGADSAGVGDEVELDDIDFGGVTFEGSFDSLDSSGIPRRGGIARLRGFLSFEDLGADAEYDKWELRAARFLTRGRHTYVGSLDGGWSPGGELPVYDEFTLGGFLSLSGFREDQLRGQYYGVARLGYHHQQ